MEIVVHFKAGETVVREGERGKGFYVLQEGELAVQKDGVEIAKITEPGVIFGEMSDVLNEPRTCTVVARTNSYVLHIPKNIDEIVDAYPSIAKKLIITLARRLKDTTKSLLVFAADETVFTTKKEG